MLSSLAMPISLVKPVRNRLLSRLCHQFLVPFTDCDGYHVCFRLKRREGYSSDNHCELEKGRKEWILGFVTVFVVFLLDEFPNLNSHLLVKFCGLKHLFRRGLVGQVLWIKTLV